MKRILYIYERPMPTVSMMQEHLYSLQDAYGLKITFVRLKAVNTLHIKEHDVVVFIRPNNILAWKIAVCARKAGCFTASFCDDDLLSLHSAVKMPWRKSGLKKTLKNSSMIISPNLYLAEKYRGYTLQKRSMVSDTMVTKEDISRAKEQREQNEEKIKLVYAASPSHEELFNEFILPVMPDIAEKYCKKISFSFISVRPSLDNFAEKLDIRYISGMPLKEYREFMWAQNFDIGVAPLREDDFSRCKYFNKFLEYSLQGVVGIYSKTEPYTYVVKDGENGFLAENSPQAWLEKISYAIDNCLARKTCLENAISLIEERFNEEALTTKMFREFPEMLEYSKNEGTLMSWGLAKLVYLISLPCERILQAFVYLRKLGINGFVSKLKTHFVEGRSYR